MSDGHVSSSPQEQSQGRAATFTRATAASLIATGSEFAVLGVLSRTLPVIPHWVDYGAIQVLGTVITFLLNRYWVFHGAEEAPMLFQGVKSAVVFGGSFVLNTGLPTIGSYVLHRDPLLAFAVAQALVYVAWNYPLNRYWVFKGTPDHR